MEETLEETLTVEETLQKIRDNDPDFLEVSLYNQNISDQGCIDFVTAMANNTVVNSVSLGSNNITDTGVEHLANMLRTNSTLKCLYLHENSIQDSTLALHSALNDNTSLSKLYLHGNNIVSTGPQYKRIEISIDKTAQNRVLGDIIHDGISFFVFI
jgi:hypothetical protein